MPSIKSSIPFKSIVGRFKLLLAALPAAAPFPLATESKTLLTTSPSTRAHLHVDINETYSKKTREVESHPGDESWGTVDSGDDGLIPLGPSPYLPFSYEIEQCQKIFCENEEKIKRLTEVISKLQCDPP